MAPQVVFVGVDDQEAPLPRRDVWADGSRQPRGRVGSPDLRLADAVAGFVGANIVVLEAVWTALVVAIATYFLLNTWLIAAAIGWSTGRNIVDVWRVDFLWSGVTYLVAGTAGGALLVAAFPAYRAVESDRRDVALAERQAAEGRAGRDLWASNCASCHGEDGEGVDAPALNSEEFLAQATDRQIHHVTQAGIPGTEMGAWWNELGGPLTDEEVRG